LEQAKESLIQEAAALVATTQTRVVSDPDYQVLSTSEVTKDTIQSATMFYKNQIALTVSIGDDTVLLETVLPIDEYPIVPIPYIHTGTPYCISIVSIVKGRQEEITKAHQIMIYNASLGSSLRWMYRVGSIDEKEWSERVTLPGGLLPVRAGDFPLQVPPAALTSAFLEISMMGSRDIDDLFGTTPVSQGKVESGGEQPYRGLLALDEFSTRRSKAWVTGSLDPALNQLAHVWQQYAAIVYTTKKVYRIVGPNNQSAKYEINVPLYGDDGEFIGKWNDLSTMKYDVKFESGGTMPVNRFAKQEEYFKYFQAGLIDDIALIAELDISHKEELIKRKSLYAQLQQAIAAKDAEIKRLSGDVETLSREVVQAGIKNKTLQSTSEISKATPYYKARLEADAAKGKASAQTTTEALRLNADHMTRMHQVESDAALKEQELTERENALAEKEKAAKAKATKAT
jgi:hypothetical protein